MGRVPGACLRSATQDFLSVDWPWRCPGRSAKKSSSGSPRQSCLIHKVREDGVDGAHPLIDLEFVAVDAV